MSVHVLLNLLNELGKRDKMRGKACQPFYLLFTKSIINSVIQKHECYIRFYLSYDPKITLKLRFA